MNNLGAADLMKGFSSEEERKIDTDHNPAKIQADLLKAFDEHRDQVKQTATGPLFVGLDGNPSESDSDAPPSANFSDHEEKSAPVETPEQKKQRMKGLVEESIRRASSASEDESKHHPVRGQVSRA
jgi:hypothetical protein